MGAENLAHTGSRSPDCPARSESLYRLRYRGSRCVLRMYVFSCGVPCTGVWYFVPLNSPQDGGNWSPCKVSQRNSHDLNLAATKTTNLAQATCTSACIHFDVLNNCMNVILLVTWFLR